MKTVNYAKVTYATNPGQYGAKHRLNVNGNTTSSAWKPVLEGFEAKDRVKITVEKLSKEEWYKQVHGADLKKLRESNMGAYEKSERQRRREIE